MFYTVSSSVPPLIDARYSGPVIGRYLLASRRGRPEGAQVFACRLDTITPMTLIATAPVSGAVGEDLDVNFEPFGLLRGRVRHSTSTGFAMTITASDEDRYILSRRIDFYARNPPLERRSSQRLLPEDPHSVVMLADGTRRACLILDMSTSGAALSIDLRLPVGTPLALGRTVARVVRPTDIGFAVRFLNDVPERELERMLHL